MTVDVELSAADLEETAIHVLSGFPPEYANPPVTSPEPIKARIEITGDTTAALSVSAETHSATALAMAFFGLSAAELTVTDLVDAVKESANVIGGALKPLLHGVTTLGIPEHNGEQIAENLTVVPYAGGTLTLGFTVHDVGASD